MDVGEKQFHDPEPASSSKHYTNEFAVHLQEDVDPDRIARENGFENQGQVRLADENDA